MNTINSSFVIQILTQLHKTDYDRQMNLKVNNQIVVTSLFIFFFYFLKYDL